MVNFIRCRISHCSCSGLLFLMPLMTHVKCVWNTLTIWRGLRGIHESEAEHIIITRQTNIMSVRLTAIDAQLRTFRMTLCRFSRSRTLSCVGRHTRLVRPLTHTFCGTISALFLVLQLALCAVISFDSMWQVFGLVQIDKIEILRCVTARKINVVGRLFAASAIRWII